MSSVISRGYINTSIDDRKRREERYDYESDTTFYLRIFRKKKREKKKKLTIDHLKCSM